MRKRLGIAIATVGILLGVVLLAVGLLRPGITISNMAPVSLGCATTLQFSVATEYYVYEVPRGGEPCASTATSAVTAVDIAGAEVVPIGVDSSVSFSYRDATAVSFGCFVIGEPGEYVLRATGPDPASMLLVGPDPNDGRQNLLVGGVAALFVGVGAALLLIGQRSFHDAGLAPATNGTETNGPETNGSETVRGIASPWAPPEPGSRLG